MKAPLDRIPCLVRATDIVVPAKMKDSPTRSLVDLLECPVFAPMKEGNSSAPSVNGIGAFFDVDNTLVPGWSIEERFFLHLWANGVVGLREVFESLLFFLRHVPPVSRQPLREHKLYLNGKRPSVIEPLAREFVQSSILPRLSRDAIRTVDQHRAQGHRVVLVTASIDFLVVPVAQMVGADALLAARPESTDDQYTGRLLPPFPYGQGKRVVVERYAESAGLVLDRCYAYGDSPGDRQILELVGNPRVVNPIRGMGRVARRQGWPIVKWK